MSLTKNIQSELSELIEHCTEFEGRYYLLYLYESLMTSKRPPDTINNMAQNLIGLIKNINKIKSEQVSAEDKIKASEELSLQYQKLIKETGATGIFYKTRQALLDLGGLIIGLITGTFGAIIGGLSLGIKDFFNFKIPSGVLVGGVTGLLIGFIIGQRTLHKLFKESDERRIRHAVAKLSTTFESLFKSIKNNHVDDIKKEILEQYFKGNKEEFDEFLNNKQPYEILSVEAIFFSTKLKGIVGHHSFIKFTINNHDKPRLIELGDSSENETEFSQRESREATGEQLMQMLAMHRILLPQYEFNRDNVWNFLKHYKAGITDCLTYLDKILVSAGEPASKLTRFLPQDTFLGRVAGGAINFFRPIPEKPKQCELDTACDHGHPQSIIP